MASQPQRADRKGSPPIAGEAFLRALADHGIDYFFANPGTDFPPIVEAYSRSKLSNAKVPTPLVIPHENLAVAMAHGAYAMSGKPQCVMLHVNVGTANAINNIINLNRDNVPLILAAGRTPVTEKGKFGGRNRYIHWGQEMFDQGGMLREAVKWDYELRVPEMIGDVVSRAYEITMSSPRGPVYLSLPREPLAAPMPEPLGPVKPRHVPAPPHADPAMIATLAEWIAAAEKPLIITTASGADAMAPLGRIAEKYALPVVTQRQRVVCLPSDHPMHMGYDPQGLIQEADLVIVIDADVPWIPAEQTPREDARFVTLGEDPAFRRYPMRSFPSDLAITSKTSTALEMLEQALAKHSFPEARTTARRTRAAEFNRKRKEGAGQGLGDADRRKDHLRLSEPAGRRDDRRGRRPLQRILADPGADRAHQARHLLRPVRRRRARLGLRRGARRQARRTRQARGRDLGRRRLHVLQPDGGALGVGRAQAADPHHRVQQQPVRRGARRDHVDVQGRRRRRGRRPVHGRPVAEPGLRGRGEGAGRPRRARREGLRTARCAGPRPRCRGQGEAPGAAQRDLPAVEALTNQAAALNNPHP